jgi:DNA-binding transcriptional LysR family regulator
MDLDQHDLYIFHQVALNQSFTQAAQALGMSKSHMSKAVRRLEEQLHYRLFQRSTRHMVLTPEGEALFQTTSRMQQHLQKGLDSIGRLHQSPSGKIRIAAPPAWGQIVLPSLLANFMQKYPDITIELTLESHFSDVIGGEYDLVFRNALLSDSSLIARHLVDLETVLVASPQTIEAVGAPSVPNDLKSIPSCMYSGRRIARWKIRKGDQQALVEIKPVMRCNQITAIKETVLHGLGMAALPKFMVLDDIASGKLVHLLPDWALPTSPFYILYPTRDFLPYKTQCFIDFMLQVIDKRVPAA